MKRFNWVGFLCAGGLAGLTSLGLSIASGKLGKLDVLQAFCQAGIGSCAFSLKPFRRTSPRRAKG